MLEGLYGLKIPEYLLPSLVFYFVSCLTIASAILVVTVKNIFHSALFLALTFLGVAGMFLFMDSGFLAAIQVLIYVGAIVTLIIFAIMLTARIGDKNIRQVSEGWIVSLLFCISLLIIIVSSILTVKWKVDIGGTNAGVAQIGKMLLGRYGLPFEIASVILLMALIGAIALGLPERGKRR